MRSGKGKRGNAEVTENTNIVGFIRFSWVALQRSEWRQTTGKSPEEIAEILFQTDRMERRFKYFEAVCLPSISLLNTLGSYVVILISDMLPSEYKDRLSALVEPFEHIMVHQTPPQELNATCLDVLTRAGLLDCETIITYRLDDDDAVFSEFDRYLMTRYGHSKFHGFGVTLPMGVEAQYRDGKIFGGHRWYRGIGAGLAFVEDPKQMVGIFATGNHTTIEKRYPTVVDPRRMGWLRLKHDTNDSDEGFIINNELKPKYFDKNIAPLFPWWANLFDLL
jgi:hypothetical protein